MPVPYLKYTDEQLFPVTNLVLPAWIVLATAPRWKGTVAIVHVMAFLISLMYILLSVNMMMKPGYADEFSKMFSYHGLIALFRNPDIILPAWLHYCAFDLWVGKWITEDSVRRHIPLLVRVPILFMTMMLGPFGLVAHLFVRGNWHEKVKAKAH